MSMNASRGLPRPHASQADEIRARGGRGRPVDRDFAGGGGVNLFNSQGNPWKRNDAFGKSKKRKPSMMPS
jgi:hypothetical protein